MASTRSILNQFSVPKPCAGAAGTPASPSFIEPGSLDSLEVLYSKMVVPSLLLAAELFPLYIAISLLSTTAARWVSPAMPTLDSKLELNTTRMPRECAHSDSSTVFSTPPSTEGFTTHVEIPWSGPSSVSKDAADSSPRAAASTVSSSATLIPERWQNSASCSTSLTGSSRYSRRQPASLRRAPKRSAWSRVQPRLASQRRRTRAPTAARTATTMRASSSGELPGRATFTLSVLNP
mmetsp:Transcript_23367/g.44515  ORF Transcript_23367/g.44515 Transcript_23367/m.44515 type:complete len:236 (-) Transcript_23367:175-882(-)